MSGFTDTMIDDGFSNEQDYFDYLCNKSIDEQFSNVYDCTDYNAEEKEEDLDENTVCAAESFTNNGGVMLKGKTIKECFISNKNFILNEAIQVTHPLIDNKLILIGFVVGDYQMNINDFIVKGERIEYKCSNGKYDSNNPIIYKHILFDNSENDYKKYYNSLNSLKYRTPNGRTFFSIGDEFGEKINYHPAHNGYIRPLSDLGLTSSNITFKYYLYTVNNEPESVANELYGLCKYYLNGEFKYMIVDLIEVKIS